MAIHPALFQNDFLKGYFAFALFRVHLFFERRKRFKKQIIITKKKLNFSFSLGFSHSYRLSPLIQQEKEGKKRILLMFVSSLFENWDIITPFSPESDSSAENNLNNFYSSSGTRSQLPPPLPPTLLYNSSKYLSSIHIFHWRSQVFRGTEFYDDYSSFFLYGTRRKFVITTFFNNLIFVYKNLILFFPQTFFFFL